MSRFLKLFNTQEELQAWLDSYTGTDVIAAYARYDNSQGEKEYELSLTASMSQTTFDYEAGSANIGIDANCPWTIVVSGDWITVSKLEGAGPDNILVSIPQNDGDEDRTGVITVSADGFEDIVFNLYQSYHSQPANEIWYSSTDGNAISNFANISGFISDTVEGNIRIAKYASAVTNLPYNAFKNCTTLKEIFLPASATTWSLSVFNNCSNLTYIKVPFGVAVIPDSTFSKCESMASVELPDSVTNIGNYAFNNCYSLTSIAIPSGVTKINMSAFAGCSSLTSVELPDGLTNIDTNAFRYCSSLATVELPSHLTNIGDYAFDGCSSIESTIEIPSGVTRLGVFAFNNCYNLPAIYCYRDIPPILGNKWVFDASSCPIYVPAGSVEAYKTAEGWSQYADRIQADGPVPTEQPANEIWYHTTNGEIADIAAGAYVKNENGNTIYSVNLSNTYENGKGVITFSPDGQYANSTAITKLDAIFSDCGNLLDVSLPSTCAYIGYSAGNEFKNCTSLTAVTFNGPMTSLGRNAFQGCTSLQSIELPEGLTEIGINAFNGCTSLQSIELPESLTGIAASAFANCTSLTGLTLPEGIEYIGASCFMNDTFDLVIPSTVTAIGATAAGAQSNAGTFSTKYAGSKVTFLNPTPITNWRTSGTYKFPNTFTIYVPDGSVDAYRDAWSVVVEDTNQIQPINGTGNDGHYSIPEVPDDDDWD